MLSISFNNMTFKDKPAFENVFFGHFNSRRLMFSNADLSLNAIKTVCFARLSPRSGEAYQVGTLVANARLRRVYRFGFAKGVLVMIGPLRIAKRTILIAVSNP